MTVIPANHQIEEVQDYITGLNNPPAVNCVPFSVCHDWHARGLNIHEHVQALSIILNVSYWSSIKM